MIHTLLRLMNPIPKAAAQVFDGPGLEDGLEYASNATSLPDGDPRTVVINAIEVILNFTALLAVIMIIIAGFYLVLSLGNEENKDKAKRIIIYTLIGLVVLLFSRIIVELVTVYLARQV